jgi:hypothetical protein
LADFETMPIGTRAAIKALVEAARRVTNCETMISFNMLEPVESLKAAIGPAEALVAQPGVER